MRFWTLFALVSIASAKFGLRTSVYAAEDDEAQEFSGATLILSVSKSPTQVALPKFLQKAGWMEVGEEQSSLMKAGFKYWSTFQHGFLFKNEDETSFLSCENQRMTSISDNKAEMQYSCSISTDGPRFKSTPPKNSAGSNTNSNTGSSSSNKNANNNANTKGNNPDSADKNTITPNFPNYAFWMPSTGAWPYGYRWPDDAWSYNYYAVTPAGYWGCPMLTSGGVCGTNPYYYPFMY